MESMISVLKTSLSVCIAFAILFFIISVVLFFLFDIRTIFNIRTGRAKKKTVQEMQAANSKTGRLRVDGKTLTSQLSKEDHQKAVKGATKRGQIVTPPPANDGYQNSYTKNTTQEIEPEQQTELLQQQTELLKQNSYEEEYSMGSAPTTQLSQDNNVQNQNQSYQVEKVRDVHFVVTKKIVVINTDETLM